jgi:hypothetical protein
MLTRASKGSFLAALSLILVAPFLFVESTKAQAADVGGVAVGAGVGLLLGGLIFRGRGNSYYYGDPYYYRYRGYNPYTDKRNQPKVVYGYYWDGYSESYGPIVVPPPGYVNPNIALTNALNQAGAGVTSSAVPGIVQPLATTAGAAAMAANAAAKGISAGMVGQPLPAMYTTPAQQQLSAMRAMQAVPTAMPVGGPMQSIVPSMQAMSGGGMCGTPNWQGISSLRNAMPYNPAMLAMRTRRHR